MGEQKPDWEAIQREFEEGNGSYQELADRHGVKKTTLYRRSRRWNGTERNGEKCGTERNGTEITPLRLLRPESPSTPHAVEGAKLGMSGLIEYLRVNAQTMDPAVHGKAANALMLYDRIITNAPADTQEEEQEDLSGFDEDELRRYAEYQERARKRA